MPREPTSRSSAISSYTCDYCGTVLGRKPELIRHAKTHATNVEELKIPCPYDGCVYRTLQKSNLKTHITAVHLRERPYQCSVPECLSAFADPAALIRHEKKHGIYRNGKGRPRAGSAVRRAKPYERPLIKTERVSSPEITIPLELDPSGCTGAGPSESSSSTFACDDNSLQYPADIFPDLFPSLSLPGNYECDGSIPHDCSLPSAASSYKGHSNVQRLYASGESSHTPTPICYNGDLTLPAFLSSSLASPTLTAAPSLFEGSSGQYLQPLFPDDEVSSLNCDLSMFESEFSADLPDLSFYLDASSPWSISSSPSSSNSIYSTPSTSMEDLNVYDADFGADSNQFRANSLL